MGLQVVVEKSLGAEWFVTSSANEWLFSCVNALMIKQFGLVGEGLITYWTCISIRRGANLLFPSYGRA